MTERNRSKLEEEVESILAKADRKPPFTAKARAWGRTLRTRSLDVQAQHSWLDKAGGWFVVGSLVTGESGLVRQIFQFAGLAAVIIGVVRLIRPAPRGGRKMWRGHPIDLRKPGVELGDKFDEWRKRR
jgi:hypothetical protein